MAKVQRTLADFRAAYDPAIKIPARIREALAELQKEGGPEAWEPEGEFIRRCKVSQTQFAYYRDTFKEHIVELPHTRSSQVKRAWFADKKTAAKARG